MANSRAKKCHSTIDVQGGSTFSLTYAKHRLPFDNSCYKLIHNKFVYDRQVMDVFCFSFSLVFLTAPWIIKILWILFIIEKFWNSLLLCCFTYAKIKVTTNARRVRERKQNKQTRTQTILNWWSSSNELCALFFETKYSHQKCKVHWRRSHIWWVAVVVIRQRWTYAFGLFAILFTVVLILWQRKFYLLDTHKKKPEWNLSTIVYRTIFACEFDN